MAEDQHITQEAGPHKYFTALPNLYDDLNLTVREFRLLAHYARVGDCYEGSRYTAKHCRMRRSKILELRKRLANKGLIKIVQHEDRSVTITVVDVWEHNTAIYGGSKKGGAKGIPPHLQRDLGRMGYQGRGKRDTRGGAKGIPKEEPLKKNPIKKKGRNSAQPLPIQVYRSITHRTPPKRTWDMIVASVDGNVLEFARHLRWWTLSNHDPTNYHAVLDAFHKDARHRGYTTTSKKGGAQGNMEVGLSWLEIRKGLNSGQQDG